MYAQSNLGLITLDFNNSYSSTQNTVDRHVSRRWHARAVHWWAARRLRRRVREQLATVHSCDFASSCRMIPERNSASAITFVISADERDFRIVGGHCVRCAMARDRRVLPHNLDAEASILGGVILRNDVLLHLEQLETARLLRPPPQGDLGRDPQPRSRPRGRSMSSRSRSRSRRAASSKRSVASRFSASSRCACRPRTTSSRTPTSFATTAKRES